MVFGKPGWKRAGVGDQVRAVGQVTLGLLSQCSLSGFFSNSDEKPLESVRRMTAQIL